MSLAISILLLLAAILLVLRFVQSRFRAASDLTEDDPDDGPDDPHSGIPVRRKGGPKGRVDAAEVEEPDES